MRKITLLAILAVLALVPMTSFAAVGHECPDRPDAWEAGSVPSQIPGGHPGAILYGMALSECEFNYSSEQVCMVHRADSYEGGAVPSGTPGQLAMAEECVIHGGYEGMTRPDAGESGVEPVEMLRGYSTY
jgi:hypothetical protein